MARYPEAAWHRCPGQEPKIRPTQLIYHTAVMRDLIGLRNYFCSGRSGGIESHFGVGGRWGTSPDQDGQVEQWRDTEEQADANRTANRRPDGTGAISVETCDNAPQLPSQIEPWTPKQVAALIRLGRWAHEHHGIPLRICRSPDDPGFGWHALWDNTRFEYADGSTPWTPAAGKVCPGPARIEQLKTIVFPAIFAGTDPEDDDMYDADAEKRLFARIEAAERRTARYVDHGDADTTGSDDHHERIRSDIANLAQTVAALVDAVNQLRGSPA